MSRRTERLTVANAAVDITDDMLECIIETAIAHQFGQYTAEGSMLLQATTAGLLQELRERRAAMAMIARHNVIPMSAAAQSISSLSTDRS